MGASREPYRVVCNQLEDQLEDTIEMLQVGMCIGQGRVGFAIYSVLLSSCFALSLLCHLYCCMHIKVVKEETPREFAAEEIGYAFTGPENSDNSLPLGW